VSIVIPAFNAALDVAVALGSVFAQSFDDQPLAGAVNGSVLNLLVPE
jgi:glycosyltransferase involved in cell wall biosynthesis